MRVAQKRGPACGSDADPLDQPPARRSRRGRRRGLHLLVDEGRRAPGRPARLRPSSGSTLRRSPSRSLPSSSIHQPSRTLRFRHRWSAPHLPLVPLASRGGRGQVQPDVAAGDHRRGRRSGRSPRGTRPFATSWTRFGPNIPARTLGASSERMGPFASEDELQGAVVVQQREARSALWDEQVTLVGGESTSEAEGEEARVERVTGQPDEVDASPLEAGRPRPCDARRARAPRAGCSAPPRAARPRSRRPAST